MLKKILITFIISIGYNALIAQCDNTVPFPAGTPALTCGLNLITNEQWAGDFNTTTGYQDQATLTFSSSINTDYITLRKAADNSIIGHGISPIMLVYNTGDGNIEMHLNTNAACGTQSINRSTYVNVLCGCNYTAQWPTTTVTILEGVNTVTTNQFAGEFNLTTGYQDEAFCTFASSVTTDYITIRRASDNAILASGLTPVAIEYATSMGNIEMHISTNAACGTQNGGRIATITHTKHDIYRGGENDGFTLASISDINPSDPVSTIYFGGENDGFTLASISDVNPSDPVNTIYFGGDNDGFTLASINDVNPSDPISTIYFGGENDGFTLASISDVNSSDPISTIYFGGENDGFGLARISEVNPSDPISTIYFGGENDGFGLESISEVNPSDPISTIYFGGENDGFASAIKINVNPNCTDNVMRWSGGESTAWENAANWDCGILPSVTDEVIIKSEVLHLPIVNTNYEIKKLVMNPGSNILINNNIIFTLNGN